MSLKPALFLTSALAGVIASSLAAEAGGMTHVGTWGGASGASIAINGLTCGQVGTPHPPMGNGGHIGNGGRPGNTITINRPVTVA